jgi:hypothetical protein
VIPWAQNYLINWLKTLIKILGEELQKEQGLDKIQNLLIDFLEEFKINYIQQIDQENFEQIIAELQQQRQLKETD